MGIGKVTFAALLIGAAGCGGAAAGGRAGGAGGAGNATGGAPARIAQVFIVAMENENIGQIYGNSSEAPYINGTLLPQFAHATGFTDELPAALPSEPHYVWLEAGTNAFADHTFTTDDAPSASNSTASTAHLATELTTAGLGWTAYEEGIDAGGCPISGAGFYAPKHDPFVFFRDVVGDPPARQTPGCAAHFKDLPALAGDLAAGDVTPYVFITPDLCHDMHGATGCPDSDLIHAGDSWLSGALPPLLAFAGAHDALVLVVWDEGDAAGRMPLLALGPAAKVGYAGAAAYTHSSVLKTVEEILGVPVLPSVAPANDLGDLLAPGALP
ncbi:MAG TPA: alkaline phosphatase family protein [Polyangia bacterium]|nr:alkaline phosphatase family protein [Polyangia bacterium]